MLVRHLTVKNWRNFRAIDVPLGDRVFIAGPNASGKSTLLDIFTFLRDVAKPGGGLQHAVAQRGGVSKLRCLAARRYPAHLEQIGANQSFRGGRCRVAEDHAVAHRPVGLVRMSNPIPVNLAVEDALSEAILRRMLAKCGGPWAIGKVYSRGGVPFVVLADLDRAECAPIVPAEWLPRGARDNLVLRFAVREVEAWVLADTSSLGSFLEHGRSWS